MAHWGMTEKLLNLGRGGNLLMLILWDKLFEQKAK